jgi:dipeptidyl aminopeptidase/acylaminoacyl peptidase
MTPLDVAKISVVVGAQVSPNGEHVAALIKSRPEPLSEGDGAGWTDLYLLSHKDTGAQPRPYVTSQESISSVHWASDSRSLTFLARRDGDRGRQLYRLQLSGGEAQRVTKLRAGVKTYQISPDGMHVAYTVNRASNNGAGRLRSNGFKQEIFEEERRNPGLVVTDVRTGRSADIKMATAPSTFAWSPDNRLLAVAVAPSGTVDDHYMKRDIAIYNPATRKQVALIDIEGKMGQFAWSPDGTRLAVLSAADINDPRDGRILVAPVTGGKGQLLLTEFPGHVRSLAWRDATTIAFALDKGTANTLAQINADGTGFKELMNAPEQLFYSWNLAADGNRWAAMCESPKHPYEVCTGRLSKGNVKRRTDSNPWMKAVRLAKQEAVTFKARDGLEIEGILIHPLTPVEGKAPLVLQVHGGPEAHVRNGWVTSYGNLGQVGAAQGMYVFYPNYRGSTGRGVAFSKLGQADAAGKEFDDLVDAIDALAKRVPIDTQRVGIAGGSYGGYASAWAATYYTERFAAAVMMVGISNKISKTGTTDIPNEEFLVHTRKRPWDDWDFFLKRSPIYYVQKGRTPILIAHGKNDPRVHPTQSMELYRQLKVLGNTPVRLVLYPGEGHGNRRAAARMDYNVRLLRWMTRYLKDGKAQKPPALPPMAVDYQSWSAPKTK